MARHPIPIPVDATWHSVHTRLADSEMQALRVIAAMHGSSILQFVRQAIIAAVAASPHHSRLVPASVAEPPSPP